MPFVRRVEGDDILDRDVNQYAEAWEGDVGKGVPMKLTEINDASAYALDVRNLDVTNGRVARFRNALSEVVLELLKDAVTIGKALAVQAALTVSGLVQLSDHVRVGHGLYVGGTSTDAADGVVSANQIVSRATTGTAPLVVSSTTEVANLRAASATQADNSDTVDGKHSTDFVRANDHKVWTLFGTDDDDWPIPAQGTLQWLNIDFAWDVTRLDFTLNGTCDILVFFSCTVKGAPGGTMDFRAIIDDAIANDYFSQDGSWVGAHSFSGTWIFENVGAGAHFVRMQFEHNGGALDPGIGWRRLIVEAIPK